MATGTKIAPGMHIDHKCRNPRCVNPAHLEPVTPSENMRRGRATRLRAEDVRAIRRRWAAGETQTDLAREFGISQTHASNIAHRLKWADLPDAA